MASVWARQGEHFPHLAGDNHPDTITAIDTYSQLLSDLGKLEEALPLKRESLQEKRRTLGDRHPDTLRVGALHPEP